MAVSESNQAAHAERRTAGSGKGAASAAAAKRSVRASVKPPAKKAASTAATNRAAASKRTRADAGGSTGRGKSGVRADAVAPAGERALGVPGAGEWKNASQPAAERGRKGQAVVHVDLTLSPSDRPLAGYDIVMWNERNRYDRLEVVHLLAMASPSTYTQLVREGSAALPWEMDLLLRHHMRQKPRRQPPMAVEVFHRCYGDLLQQFNDPKFSAEVQNAARIMLYNRFAAMLGRTIYSVYRWFERTGDGKHGSVSGPLKRLFAMLPEDPAAMREELERTASLVFKARGRDLNHEYPLPNPNRPPAPRRSGPKPRAEAAA